ncbi:MAG: hypothetical protein KDA32_07830 [Phycisphaerales bacterium]|nr:hypothetical protein [Phycisphaerales bacterium]
MSRFSFRFVFGAIPILALTALSNAADKSAAEYVPSGAVAAVSLHDGAGSLERLKAWMQRSGVEDARLIQYVVESPQYMQAQIFAAGFAASAKMDLWQAASAILGRDVTIAVFPGSNKEAEAMVVAIASDSAGVARLLEMAHTLTGLTRDGAPDPQRSFKVGDNVVYRAPPKALHCFTGDALIVTNSERLMRVALGSETKLASDAAYRAAEEAAPKDAVVVGYANLAALREIPKLKAALEQKPREPLPGMLVGGWQQHLRSADEVTAWLAPSASGLKLQLATRGGADLPTTHAGYAPTDAVQYEWRPDELPRYLSQIQIERDWGKLFNEREALLSLPAVGDLVRFATNISTILGGMDFVNDVLGNVQAPLRLVMTRCDLSDARVTPSPILPGFALIAPLRPDLDEMFERKLFAAAQSAINIININGGQQGMPSFLSEVDRYRGYRVLFSEYVDPPGTEGMETAAGGEAFVSDKPRGSLRYNFAPCVSIAERQLLVTTSPQLLRDLIDAIDAHKSAPEKASRPTLDAVDLDFATLADLLRDNRAELVINRMLQEARTREVAEREIDAFVELLRYGRSLRVALETRKDGLKAVAELDFRAGADK